MSNEERIDRLKKLIEGKEEEKAELKKQYEMNLSAIDNEINQFKIALADVVLGVQDGEKSQSEDLHTFVSVKFNDSGKTYDYLWDSREEVKVGDFVEVDSRWNGTQAVEVVRVFEENVGYMNYEYKSARPIA